MSVKVCQKYWVEKPVPTIKSVAIDLNHEFTEPLLKNKQEIQSYIFMLDDLLEKKYRFQKYIFFKIANIRMRQAFYFFKDIAWTHFILKLPFSIKCG